MKDPFLRARWQNPHKVAKYEVRIMLDDGWGPWHSTTVKMIVRLHRSRMLGWPKLWLQWQEQMGLGNLIQSDVDNVLRQWRAQRKEGEG